MAKKKATRTKRAAKPRSKRSAPAARTRRRTRTRLRGVSDIRRFFHRNETPIYFVSATNFNLLGVDEWVRNFTYINSIDCFDGAHPNVLVPEWTPHEPFESLEDIVNYLLQHKQVVDRIRSRGKGGKAVFLMFDEKTEAICRDLGLQVCFPKARLRTFVDNKINTTRIADRAGVRSVPNSIARIRSYDELRKASRRLGDRLVVQTAFGDSGHTTFFIESRADWDKHEKEIVEAPEVKVMRRIKCRGSALEACVTRHGTIVGPLMTELIGFPELTPYKGGWCGNEVCAGAFDRAQRNWARKSAFQFGEELRRIGYKGYFELDFLTDVETGRMYLGECNPRITGASSMTNLAAFAHADCPLFLFHLLEWMGVNYEVDVEELNARWADPDNIDTWSQLIIKSTVPGWDVCTQAPRSGIWDLSDQAAANFVRVQTHRRTVQSERQGFYLRITGPGDYRYEGGDLGILVSPGRFMDQRFRLNARAKSWISSIRAHYAGAPESEVFPPTRPAPAEVGSFKVY